MSWVGLESFENTFSTDSIILTSSTESWAEVTFHTIIRNSKRFNTLFTDIIIRTEITIINITIEAVSTSNISQLINFRTDSIGSTDSGFFTSITENSRTENTLSFLAWFHILILTDSTFVIEVTEFTSGNVTINTGSSTNVWFLGWVSTFETFKSVWVTFSTSVWALETFSVQWVEKEVFFTDFTIIGGETEVTVINVTSKASRTQKVWFQRISTTN